MPSPTSGPRGKPTIADFEAMWADLGYSPSAEERAALERSLPVVNAMSDAELNATLTAAKATIRAATPWWERMWNYVLDLTWD